MKFLSRIACLLFVMAFMPSAAQAQNGCFYEASAWKYQAEYTKGQITSKKAEIAQEIQNIATLRATVQSSIDWLNACAGDSGDLGSRMEDTDGREDLADSKQDEGDSHTSDGDAEYNHGMVFWNGPNGQPPQYCNATPEFQDAVSDYNLALADLDNALQQYKAVWGLLWAMKMDAEYMMQQSGC